MYREKQKRFNKNKKAVILITSLVLLLVIAVNGTMAYMKTVSDRVENIFTPSEIIISIDEDITENTKSNIVFTNDFTDKAVTAYIRATLVINWTDTIDGNSVLVPEPAGASVDIGDLLGNGWIKVNDIYYYTLPVEPGDSTTVMLDTITVTVPEGSTAQCHIDVHAEGIQAEPASVVASSWKDVKVDSSGNLEAAR